MQEAQTLLYTSAQELKKLRATEGLCQRYCNISYAVGKDKLAGILLVIAPNCQGEWIECTSKDAIKDACINAGQQLFHRTACTPPMTAPLHIPLLGCLGIGNESNCILIDNYKSKPGTNQYAQLRLKLLV
jgi:hypothetical protein